MTTNLRKAAQDTGTYFLFISLYDELDQLVTPTHLNWTLRNELGEIVNDRENVIVTPASQIVVVLQDNDLRRVDGSVRVVVVDGRYDSTYGSYLHLIDSALFQINDIDGV